MKIYAIGNDNALAQRLKSVKAEKTVSASETKEVKNDSITDTKKPADIPETAEERCMVQEREKPSRKTRFREAKEKA